jgi:hypothetical protein
MLEETEARRSWAVGIDAGVVLGSSVELTTA